MTVVVYRSTDASAPVLTGQVGSLITVLDACLVTGYGAKPGAGWTKPFVGTNKAVFRNDSTTGTGMYIRIDDDGPVTPKEARVRCYENMTGLDTGTGPFPTSFQSDILNIRKSKTPDSQVRNWVVISNHRTCYVFTDPTDFFTVPNFVGALFGDFNSYVPNDQYGNIIIANWTENTTTSNYTLVRALTGSPGQDIQGLDFDGHFISRPHNGIGSSTRVAKGGDVVKMNRANIGGNGLPYPHPGDNALLYGKIFISTRATTTIQATVRGTLVGLWCPYHGFPLTTGDTILTNDGRTLEAFNIAQSGQVLMETSNTWYI